MILLFVQLCIGVEGFCDIGQSRVIDQSMAVWCEFRHAAGGAALEEAGKCRVLGIL